MDLNLLKQLVSINSGSDNLEGLAAMLAALKTAFHPLNAAEREIELPKRIAVDEKGTRTWKSSGNALHLSKHPGAKRRVLLVGHMDTVFAKDSAFQQVSEHGGRMQGPGCADMKGGIVILLEALKQLEASSSAGLVGWDVLLTSDEEIGSPSSKELLKELAKQATVGLVFEPSLPDGSLVSARKGSATLSIIARGKAAHVGREHHLGVSAINKLIDFTKEVLTLHAPAEGILLNVGHIHGGTSANVVADLATAKINIRAERDLEEIIEEIKGLAHTNDVEVVLLSLRPPKPFDTKTEKLFKLMKASGEHVGISLKWAPSGGVCDGNFLAAVGLPTIDTLGAVGGNIHTAEEYIEIESLQKRADMVAHFLIHLNEASL